MSLRIEAFEPPGGGAKWALPVIGEKVVGLEQALEMGRDGGKYSRQVLISMEKGGRAYYEGSVKWDAVFMIKESVDAQLALTYLTNMGRGGLCYIDAAKVDMSEALLTKILGLSKSHGLTVLWSCNKSVLGKHDVDGIFFPEVYPETRESKEVEEILRGKMGTVDIGTILKELRASNAVLQWSKWGEPNNIGSLYWNYQGSEKKLDGDSLRRAILSVLGAAG